MTFTDTRLDVGDIITILDDGYGHPYREIDPMTMKPTGALKKFRVVATDTAGVTRLEPVTIPLEPCEALRGIVYKDAVRR